MHNMCPFKFFIFLSTTNNKWYLSYSPTSHQNMCHHNHFQPQEDHLSYTYKELSQDIKAFIQQSIENNNNGTIIIHMVSSMFGINITENTIKVARREYANNILRRYGLDPGNTSCDKLLQFFRANTDISFLAITHSVNSGFVTTRKSRQSKKTPQVTETEYNVDARSISNDDVKCWRDELKVTDGKEILVALAWVHEDEMRNISLFPEFLSIDVTFGVNKERRNLLRVCGIDGNFKVFTAFNCFMPSKQFRAYDWVCRVAFPKLVGIETLKFNSLITSDQESPLYTGIRNLMGTSDVISKSFPLARSRHRFDMYHIFIKEWRNEVSS